MTTEDLVSVIEEDDRSQRARILVLLYAHALLGKDTPLDLVRLAYLDYFLRFPVSLQAVLRNRGHKATKLQIEAFERESIESRYGALYVEPWDAQYRRWLAAEFAAGRVAAKVLRNDEFTVELTDLGLRDARLLASNETFVTLYERAALIVRNLNLTSSTLRSAIRKALPQTVSFVGQAV